MKIDTRKYYDFEDVMICPQLSNKNLNSRNDVDLLRTFPGDKPHANRLHEWTGVPIIAANMDTTGTFEIAKVLFEYSCCTALHKHYSVDELVNFFRENAENDHLLFYTMGINEDSIEKFNSFVRRYRVPKNICIDVANGYSPRFIDFVSEVRNFAPESLIMAGNVVTGDATYALIDAGASIVKVGLGNGSACTTRRITGVGMPQLSAVLDCANAAHSLDGLICSDGGCVNPGDVSKAIGAGADFVMLGGMLAGHEESGGETIVKIQRINDVLTTVPVYKEFYGMSSDTAMERYSGGVANYRASEGRTVRIPYKGPIANTIEEILGGLRSTMTYVGASKLKELSKCVQFIAHSRQLNTSLIQYEQ